MAILEAFADLFTDEPANSGNATPANVANPAKPRIVPSAPEVANACESCESQTTQSEKQTRFAAIRSHSQTAKPAPECARSQDSQHSQRANGKTFAESINGYATTDTQQAADAVGIADAMPLSGYTPPADTPPPKPIARAVLRFTLTAGGGTVLGQPDDTPASLLADLRDKWPDRLVAVWNGDEQIWP